MSFPFPRRRTIAAALCAAAGLFGAVAPAQAQIESRTIKFPSASNKGHPQVWGVEKFVELVAAKSGGKLDVKPYPGGTLGPDVQIVSAMQGGTIEMNVMNASLLAGTAKEMTLFDMPWLFADAREADAIADGPIGKKLLAKLEEKGLVGLAYWDLGFRQIHTGKKVIAKADDFKGVKLRVIPTKIYVDLVTSWGANPVPMPFTETYSALEQGAIDGMTNPLLNIIDGKYDEVTKHLTLTNHMYTPQAVIVGKKFWDKLSAQEQKILRDAAQETAVLQRKFARDEAAKALAELKKRGMTVHELSADEIAKLRTRSQPVFDKYAKEIGEPLVQEVLAELKTLRGGK
jgi:TRAP-type transport system periplasmic protein